MQFFGLSEPVKEKRTGERLPLHHGTGYEPCLEVQRYGLGKSSLFLISVIASMYLFMIYLKGFSCFLYWCIGSIGISLSSDINGLLLNFSNSVIHFKKIFYWNKVDIQYCIGFRCATYTLLDACHDNHYPIIIPRYDSIIGYSLYLVLLFLWLTHSLIFKFNSILYP